MKLNKDGLFENAMAEEEVAEQLDENLNLDKYEENRAALNKEKLTQDNLSKMDAMSQKSKASKKSKTSKK